MKNHNKEQNYIIDSINKEFALEMPGYKPSPFRTSVWFYPLQAKFLYNDQFMNYEAIQPLIENEVLIYDGLDKHQGDRMLKYNLNPIFLTSNKKINEKN